MSDPAAPRTVSPAELETMLGDGDELALLDVREEGPYAQGHPFWAASLPLSRLELRIADLVPRTGARVVLCDGGEGLAQRAASRLAGFGYSAVRVLAGGAAAWKAAGHELFQGMNVPSKAFGEQVARSQDTPMISADELHALLEGSPRPLVLDSRPLEEYRAMNIPGAIDVPGGELVYRLRDLAPSPETLVVVNCAGRTRSIIGAQSLIDAGAPNRVVALRDGTMGWHLAGHDLEHGNQRRAPPISHEGFQWAHSAADRIARRFGVRRIAGSALSRWEGESGERTLYLLDVRSSEEYESGHRPGARTAPGGQLIQATDHYMATRGARVVLTDDTGVRATLAASWLARMGWRDVAVLEDELDPRTLERGPHAPLIPGLDEAPGDPISPAELAGALEAGEAVVADVGTSREFQRVHVRGAWFLIRSRMAEDLPRLPRRRTLVLTSPDGVLARLAAPEARALWKGSVRTLRGGTAAWRADGQRLMRGLENLASATDDLYLLPHEGTEPTENAMRAYLEWEVTLPEQMEREGIRFATFPKD